VSKWILSLCHQYNLKGICISFRTPSPFYWPFSSFVALSCTQILKVVCNICAVNSSFIQRGCPPSPPLSWQSRPCAEIIVSQSGPNFDTVVEGLYNEIRYQDKIFHISTGKRQCEDQKATENSFLLAESHIKDPRRDRRYPILAYMSS
jgi:hypothetical protein